jgi:membrane protein
MPEPDEPPAEVRRIPTQDTGQAVAPPSAAAEASDVDPARTRAGQPRLTPDHEPFYEPWHDPGRHYGAGPPATSHTGAALEVERRVLGASRLVDRLQSRFAPVAFGYGVFKKYADDEGSRLAALLAYYTFLSFFPLLIGGYALLNRILVNQPDAVERVVEEVVPPELQDQVISAYESLPSSGVAFTVAIVGLLLSGTGGVFSLYAMVNQVYAVPYRHRFGFGPRYGRVLLLVLLMGIGTLLVATGSAFLATYSDVPSVQRVAGFVLIWLVASGLLYAAASVLTRRSLGFAEVGLGAALGGVAMTLVISLGSALLGRFIQTSSTIYGVFATVVGIITMLFFVSNAIVFCFEISVVRAWRLWPRGVDINLLFPADDRAYALLTLMDERMPSQRNGIAFDAAGHDDPRRPDFRTLSTRPPGIPLRPYDDH